MTVYVEIEGPAGTILIKPEWMIALTPREDGWNIPVRRVYMHGGGQILVLDTPENIQKLLSR